MARQEISLLTRFKVLRRDHFTCMYCGARPPYVRLHVDHVVAVSRGGANGESNLISACSDCNLGKSNIEFEHPRPDGTRYEPLSRCSCPRPTCGGPGKGRDAAELECECSGCHDCDICGNVYCDRKGFSAEKIRQTIAERSTLGCVTVQWAFERGSKLLAAHPDMDVEATCSDKRFVNLSEVRADLLPWIREDIVRVLACRQENQPAAAPPPAPERHEGEN